MSREEDEIERQYRYARKFEKMVKEFEGLIELVDARTNMLKRRSVTSHHRRGNPTSTSEGSNSARAARGSSSSPANATHVTNQALVQAITNHLNDLKNDQYSDSECTAATDN